MGCLQKTVCCYFVIHPLSNKVLFLLLNRMSDHNMNNALLLTHSFENVTLASIWGDVGLSTCWQYYIAVTWTTACDKLCQPWASGQVELYTLRFSKLSPDFWNVNSDLITKTESSKTKEQANDVEKSYSSNGLLEKWHSSMPDNLFLKKYGWNIFSVKCDCMFLWHNLLTFFYSFFLAWIMSYREFNQGSNNMVRKFCVWY